MKQTRILALCLALLLLALSACGASYQIKFDPNGGTLVSGIMLQTVQSGKLPEEPELARTGYDFLGWEPALTKARESATYVAQWERRVLTAEEIADLFLPCVVEITAYNEARKVVETGSGFFLDGSGTIVTAWHVIENAYKVTARGADGQTWDAARIRNTDPAGDLAILQVEAEETPCLTLCPDGAKAEDTVFLLGRSQDEDGAVMEGVVRDPGLTQDEMTYLQTTVERAAKYSGGPLVNVYGEVLGVQSAVPAPQREGSLALSAAQLEALDQAASPGTRVYHMVSAGMVELRTFDAGGQPLGGGAGFLIDEQGTVVTHCQALQNASSARAVLSNGALCDVTAVKGYDKAAELAVLQIDASVDDEAYEIYLSPAQMDAYENESVYLPGAPGSLAGQMSQGLVSGPVREGEVDYIAVTLHIMEEDQGSPVVNSEGEVLGVATARRSGGDSLAVDIARYETIDQSQPMSVEAFAQAAQGAEEPAPAPAETPSFWDWLKGLFT